MNKLYALLAYAYTGLIVVASLGKFAIGMLPKNVVHSDKIGHFLAYTLFAFIWGLFFYRVKRMKQKTSAWIGFAWSVFFGAFMEFCQWIFTSYRQFDYYDMLANSVGGLLGMLVFSVFFKIIEKRQG